MCRPPWIKHRLADLTSNRSLDSESHDPVEVPVEHANLQHSRNHKAKPSLTATPTLSSFFSSFFSCPARDERVSFFFPLLCLSSVTARLELCQTKWSIVRSIAGILFLPRDCHCENSRSLFTS